MKHIAKNSDHTPTSILLVTASWPPLVGGAENYLFEIYRRLTDARLVVLTSEQPGDADFDKEQVWQTIRVPLDFFTAYWSGRRKRLAALAKLYAILLEYKIDLVVSGFAFPDGLIGWMLKQVFGLPCIIHFYGIDFLRHISDARWRDLLTRAFRDADNLIGCSSYSRDKVIEEGFCADKIHVVHPGVDAERYRPVSQHERQRIRKELGLSEEIPVLLTVSRLVARKGHDYVLRALPRILCQHPQVTYLIVGKGKQRQTLQALVDEYNLSESVRFLGEVSEAELPLVYQAADLFIMPNREINGDVEGFGIVFIEASASGIPVIGGANGGTRDAIAEGRSGFLVSPNDPDEIANCVVRLLSDQALSVQMGEDGRRMVEKRYTWNRAAKQVAEIIEITTYSQPRRHSRLPHPIRAIHQTVRRD